MNKEQNNKNKIILAVGIIIILTGMIFLIASITTLKETLKLNVFYGLEPIKTGSAVSIRDEEYADVFNIVTGELGENFNPLFAEVEGELIVSELVFEPLLKRDATGELKLCLADNISYSDDEKVLTITIKDDVLFSDGSKLTASDVEYSLMFHALFNGIGTDNLEGVNAFRSSPHSGLAGVKTIDDNTLTVAFSKYDIDNLLILETLIQKAKHIEWSLENDLMQSAEERLGNGIGSGAYTLVDTSIRNAGLIENVYHRDENQGIQIVQVLHESAVDVEKYLEEQLIDMVTLHRESGYFDEMYNNENIDVYSKERAGTLALFFNMENAFTSSNDLRASISYALNRDAFIEEVEGINNFIPVSSMLSAEGFTKDLQTTTPDIAQAKTLLESAKVELGLEEVTLYLPVVKDNEIQIGVAKLIKEQLAEIGIKITVDELSLSDYMDAIYMSNRYSLYISELDYLTTTNSIKLFSEQFFYNQDLPLDYQLEYIVFAKGEEEKLSSYEAFQKALLQQSSIVPFARIQDFTIVSNHWGNITILPDKNAPHDLHLLVKK